MTDRHQAQFKSQRVRAALAGAAMLAGASLIANGARATPATLANDADVAAFAARVKAYENASRVRWVVAAPTRADADALVAGVANHLAPEDRRLIARVKAESFADNPDVPRDSSVPIAWMAPQIGRAQGGPTCSWQVWVTDPDAPSLSSAANVPLAPNDRLPVGPSATFRVGYTGLLQSKLYAFGETKPGDIRDLASAPDVNIPVSTSGGETILLAMARQPAPFLEGIHTALSSSAGQRRDLGKQFALRENLLGRGRGIGANIQLVTPNMVVVKNENDAGAPPPPEPIPRFADGRSGDLMETCLFSLIPAQTPTQ